MLDSGLCALSPSPKTSSPKHTLVVPSKSGTVLFGGDPMTKRVLDVGNCTADHSSISELIESAFDATVIQAHDAEEAAEAVTTDSFDLVLVNRIIDRNQSSGLDIIQRIKSDSRSSSTPVMMITNFPEHQDLAIEAGAQPGFGKSELGSAELIDKLRKYLE